MPPSTRSRFHRLHRAGATAVALAAVLVLTACGGAAGGDSPAAPATGGDTARAETALEAAYTGRLGTPPTTPTTPPPGINLWVVSCGEQIPACAEPAAATAEAAEVVGWTANVCDGQLNPNGWGTCVRQAISAGADVVVPIGIDCASVQQPFQEAKDAGVTVVGGGASDCSATGGQNLWATERVELEGVDNRGLWDIAGTLSADWFIGRSGATTKVLEVRFTDPAWGPWLSDAFRAEIGTCTGCEVVDTLELANADVLGGTLAQKFSTALLQNPEATAVFVPVAGWMTAGLAQAVVASGRSDQLDVMAMFGSDANIELIRSNGGQDAALGFSTAWGGWGSVDTAIRVLNDEPVLPGGNGYVVIDGENNLPEPGQAYANQPDFRSDYSTVWGVG